MKSPLKVCGAILSFTFIVVVLLFIFHQFIFGFIGVICLVIFSFFWYRRLVEDLIVYYLRKNSGHFEYEKLIKIFPKKGVTTIDRLIKKEIVEVKKNVVYLLDEKYVSAFGQEEKGC